MPTTRVEADHPQQVHQPADEQQSKLLDIGAGTNEIRPMLIGRELIGA